MVQSIEGCALGTSKKFWYNVGTYRLETAEEKYFKLPLVDGNVELKRVNGIVKFNKDTRGRSGKGKIK